MTLNRKSAWFGLVLLSALWTAAMPAHCKEPQIDDSQRIAENLPAIPVQKVYSIRTAGRSGSNALVRVQGTVLDQRMGEYIVVHDESGTIFAETRQTILPKVKERVDLWGRAVFDASSLRLEDALVRRVDAAGLSDTPESAETKKPATLPTLTKAWEIRDLPATKAAWRYPVRLQAVVTVNTKAVSYFMAQDDTAGISVLTKGISTNLNPGDLVQIEGVSNPGGFSPIVAASNVVLLGSGALPEPRQATLFQLASGQDGSQWIEVRGVVRSLSYDKGLARLGLNDLSGMLTVIVPAPFKPTNLLDAIVSIRGACGSKANTKRQFTRFEMWASSLDYVKIEEPGVSDPLSLPAQPIANLSQFHPRETLQHRVNIVGLVTLCIPGQCFFIQDAEDGVEIMTSPEDITPGDYVMAAGYPARASYGPVLQNAVCKRLARHELPAPQALKTGERLDPQLNSRRVVVTARFLNHTRIGSHEVLTLELGDRIFEAHCLAPLPDAITKLPAGSLLQATGVYRVLVDEARVPASFQIMIASAQDVHLIEKPSWWTARHASTVFGSMAAVIAATVLWGLLLRHKIHKQTRNLKQSEQKFRTLVEESLVGVYTMQEKKFSYVNPRLATIFGYTREEIMRSASMADTLFGDDLPLVQEQVKQYQPAAEIDVVHYTFSSRRKDGTPIHLEALGSRTEIDGQPAVLGMLLDVTERQRAQDKIAQQARLLDLACDAIMVRDFKDHIVYWNKSAGKMYGWTPQEVLGRNAVELTQTNPSEYAEAKKALLETGEWRGQLLTRNRKGDQLTVEARWTLVHDSKGKPESILAINTDITQQKKLETQFLRAQRLESIGILAGGIAHDLNNVLAPILMSCDLLKLELSTDERDQLLDSVLSNTNRAANLVKQILTFARGTDGRHLPVSPRILIEDLRRILDETLPKSIRLEVLLQDDLWNLTADSTQVHQVLMNLCLNGRDAMPDGGQLTVLAENCQLDDHYTAMTHENNPGAYVVITVADTGQGMSPDLREKIFDPFFTTKEVGKGTGLGLSTSLGIIKSHNGFINVYSEPGKGSSFKVYLPAQTGSQPAAGVESRQVGAPRGNGELILVVDDEHSVRTVAKQTLEMHGYRAITANDGMEAITCYTREKNNIAAVLLDMMMPVMDGPATVHALVRMNPEIKIIAASGLAHETFVKQLKNSTVKAFMPKPYTATTLLKTMQEVLSQN